MIKPKVFIISVYKERTIGLETLKDSRWNYAKNYKNFIYKILINNDLPEYFLNYINVSFYKKHGDGFGQQAITKGPGYLRKLLEL